MKVPADDVPQEYAGLLRVEGHSEETIAEYVKKYEAVVASYGEKYWPYNCKATYKGYLKYYIDKVRELGATPVIVTSAARQYFKEGRMQYQDTMAEVINSAIFHMCAQQSRLQNRKMHQFWIYLNTAAACLRCLARRIPKVFKVSRIKMGLL